MSAICSKLFVIVGEVISQGRLRNEKFVNILRATITDALALRARGKRCVKGSVKGRASNGHHTRAQITLRYRLSRPVGERWLGRFMPGRKSHFGADRQAPVAFSPPRGALGFLPPKSRGAQRAAWPFPFGSLALAGKLRRRGNAAPPVVGRADLRVRRHFGRETSAAPFAARGGPGRQVSVARSSEIRNWPKETKGNIRGEKPLDSQRPQNSPRPAGCSPIPSLSASCVFFGHPVLVFGFTRPAWWQPDL